MTRIVKRESAQPDLTYLRRLTEDYKKSKEAQEQFEKRTNNIKKELSDAVVQMGTPDDKGNIWLDLGDIKLKRERRISRSLDIDSAVKWAQETGVWDDVKEIIEVLSEDKLLGLAWERKELEEAIQAFYIEKETWAFKA